MTEIPEITEGFDHHEAGKPGWISPVTNEGKICKPIIRCNCGLWVGLGLHHVHVDGTVTASFYHKKGTNFAIGESPEGCEWHVMLKLMGYDKGDFPPNSGASSGGG